MGTMLLLDLCYRLGASGKKTAIYRPTAMTAAEDIAE